MDGGASHLRNGKGRRTSVVYPYRTVLYAHVDRVSWELIRDPSLQCIQDEAVLVVVVVAYLSLRNSYFTLRGAGG